MEKLNLEAIPEDVRWTIANALRAAADKWEGYRNEMTDGRVRDQFTKQAAEAREIAEQMEDC